jgi:diadenosine tetraphosphatase ApaH/serine/threonine PP2A family protein phosphatase
MLADLCLTAQPERISAVGHSHVALSFSRDQEAEASGTPRDIGEIADLTSGEWLINPGSVGQPRDGNPDASYMLYEGAPATAGGEQPDGGGRGTLTLRRVTYPVASVQQKMRQAGLPSRLIMRLTYGW